MTINQSGDKSNPPKDLMPTEEEFDIVSVSTPQKKDFKGHAFNLLLIILIASASFGLGRYTKYEENKVPVRIVEDKTFSLSAPQVEAKANGVVKGVSTMQTQSEGDGTVVASKNGSKYHYPWCGGAKQIAEKNKITFNSIEEARKAGYTPAANCKGLK